MKLNKSIFWFLVLCFAVLSVYAATQLQLRRGTTAQNNAFTGAAGEIVYDTELKQLRVHDGATAGGLVIGRERVLSLDGAMTNAVLWGIPQSGIRHVIATNGTNSLVVGNPARGDGISQIHLRDGALWVPEFLSWGYFPASGNEFAGAVNFYAAGEAIPQDDPLNYNSPFAKLTATTHWGGAVYEPWAMLTCLNLRLEEGWQNYQLRNPAIHIGNEDHYGSVVINYTQPWDSMRTPVSGGVGRGRPLVFAARGRDGSGYLRAEPGIQSRPAGRVYERNNLADGSQSFAGELYFHSLVPLATTNGASPGVTQGTGQDQATAWNTLPGRTNAIMHVDSWEFFQKGVLFGDNGSGAANDANLASSAPRITMTSTNWPPGILGGNVGTVAATVAISGSSGQFTCNNSALQIGAYVVIKGTLGGTATISGYASGTMYKVSAVTGTTPNVTAFTLTTLAGAAITTTAGTLTGLTYDIIPLSQANELAKASYPQIVIGTNLIPSAYGNNHMAVPNGFMIADAVKDGSGNRNKIWFLASHSGASDNDGLLLIAGARDLDLLAGNNGTVQIGNSGNNLNQYINIQYNQNIDRGYSHLFGFKVKNTAGSVGSAALLAQENGNSAAGYADLHFYSKAPTFPTAPSTGLADSGVRVLSVDTDAAAAGTGIRIDKRLTQARVVQSGSTISLNFGAEYLQDVVASSATLTIAFANRRPGDTNIVKKLLYLRSADLTVSSITWPSSITVVSESGSATALPTSLAADKVMRVEFESIGSASADVLARYSVGTDNWFAYDTDAQSFFTSASITDPLQKIAVNQLVIDLKAGSLWTKMHALYPFVGGNATAHSYNLRNTATFQITWTGAGVVHNSHTTGTITGNGTTAYGDTGYTPSTSGSRDSQHIAVYNRTPAPTELGHMLGGDKSDGADRLELFRNGTSMSANVNDAVGSCDYGMSTDLSGFLAASRTASTGVQIENRILTADYGCTVNSTALPNAPVYILARNYAGAGAYTTANLAFASIGSGLTSDELRAFEIIVNTFETTLGRNVP